MENMLKFGPQCMKGKIWDEGGKSNIVQIIISHSDFSILSIQFVYVLDGKVCRSDIHGDPVGPKFSTVTLDYPSEFLISVSGETLETGADKTLGSLSFKTNKRSYGPFGKTAETVFRFSWWTFGYRKFSYDFGSSPCFAGFHGSAATGYDGGLHAIGVYVKPIQSLSELDINVKSIK